MGMNVVHSGGTFQIYGDSLKTYDKLPVGTYEVGFNKFSGFFLTAHSDLEVNEEKVYGCSEQKVQKVLKSFSRVGRNFGVILSGRKGIGKSLFARLLAVHAKGYELPLILVTEYVPGIANFCLLLNRKLSCFSMSLKRHSPARMDAPLKRNCCPCLMAWTAARSCSWLPVTRSAS